MAKVEKEWNVDGTVKFSVSAQGIKAKTKEEAKEKAESMFEEVFIDWSDQLTELLVSQISPYEVEIDSVEEE